MANLIKKTGSTSCFKRAALAVAVAGVCIPPAAMAEDWKYNTELFISPGDSRTIVGVSSLVPLSQDADSMTYFDGRFIHTSESTEEFNIGLGHRWFNPGHSSIYGLYLAVDTRKTQTDNRFNQITFGGEVLTDDWEARANYYHPTTNEKLLRPGVTGGSFSGGKIFVSGVYEEAMQGFDIEVGKNFSIGGFDDTWAYIGAYHYEADIAKDADGVSFRLETHPRKNITIGLALQNDDLFGSEGRVEMKWAFGHLPQKKGKRTLHDRMVQFVHRDIDIVNTGGLDENEITGGDLVDITPAGGVLHIDSDAAGSTEDGTIDNPFLDFTACQGFGGANCDDDDTLGYVHMGDGSTYDTNNHKLPDNQQMIGEGANFFGLGGDGDFSPVSANSPVFILGDDNEIAGFDINDDIGAGDGISGTNITGFNIHHNTFSGNDNAIYIYTNDDNSTTGNIAYNTIDPTLSHSIFLHNLANDDDTTSPQQNITVMNNSITNAGANGIYALNEIDQSSSSGSPHNFPRQIVTISGNTITDSMANGIEVYNEVDITSGSYGNSAIQTATISNNTIIGSVDDGIHAHNDIDNDSSETGEMHAARQTLSILNNWISGSGDDGIEVSNYASATSGGNAVATQTATVSGNTLIDNDYGIYLDNEAQGAAGGTFTEAPTDSNTQ